MNCRSVRNKTDDVVDYITEYQPDLMALTETWLHAGTEDHFTINELTPSGYTFLHTPRGRRGGGTAFLFKSGFKATLESPVAQFSSFEHMSIRLTLNNVHTATVIVVYRPPSVRGTAVFFREFTTLCEQHVVTRNLFIVGDFNFHMDVSTDTDAKRMTSLLDSMDLRQHVTFPTHQAGHTLDLLISRISDNLIVPGSENHGNFISDHCIVRCHIRFQTPDPINKIILYRKLKCINRMAFEQDLFQSSIVVAPKEDLPALVRQYCSDLSQIVEKHAPLKERRLLARPHSPWYTDEISEAKKLCCR